ncbi:SixA phosphatase family protein [Flexithrix dorotheae]|uniref:SixA phosphatase family protein n=1 Tax=Flexithrix dorotheae TaxID=70993 RepID=UPI00036C23CA|nr:histidine phosphatase family protein [Flexithrix dorotheae]
MKTLYLVRHAKSSWKDISLDDFDRPLNKRGKRDAPFMGKRLKKQGIKPHLILASPAKRAKKTAKIFAREMGYPEGKIKFAKKIYEAGRNELLEVIRNQDDKINSLMLVGHNPELTSLSNYLSDYEIVNIPTSGISCIKLSIDTWNEIKLKAGEQSFFDYPKRHLVSESTKT